MHRTVTAFALSVTLSFTAPTLLDSFWASLSALWNGTEEGGGGDPNGRCLPAPLEHADAGGGCDPDGRCNPGS